MGDSTNQGLLAMSSSTFDAALPMLIEFSESPKFVTVWCKRERGRKTYRKMLE